MYKNHTERIKRCDKILKNKNCMCLDKNNNITSKSCHNENKQECKDGLNFQLYSFHLASSIFTDIQNIIQCKKYLV